MMGIAFLVTCLSYTADLLMWKFFVYFVSVALAQSSKVV